MSTKKLSTSHDVHNLLEQAKSCNQVNGQNINHSNDPVVSHHLNSAQGRYLDMIGCKLQSKDGEPKAIVDEVEQNARKE